MSITRSWLEIDTAKIVGNYEKIRKRAGIPVIPVIKANAYGLGVERVLPLFAEAPYFGVATVEEALQLKRLGRQSMILGGLVEGEIAPGVEGGVILPAGDLELARKISAEAVRQHRTVEIALPVDSGMGRIGLLPETAEAEIREILQMPNLKARGIFSHLSCAPHPEDGYSLRQIRVFTELVDRLKRDGIDIPDVHIAASDGYAPAFAAAFQPPFTMARVGLDLYGFNPNPLLADMKLEPVAQLKSSLIAVRMLKEGTGIGYNRLHTLPEDTLVGTVAIGYEDGVPLACSNRGNVLVNGILCPIIGRVAMDYIMVSLANAPHAKVGDEVVLWGTQGDRTICISAWCETKGTHAHDILCAIGNRVERRYL